ncbi:flippase [Megamonas funiformis]|uniref:flippase n=1 Tax=Megamonas funiformis TaxID=437897 RepID=UPI0039955D35
MYKKINVMINNRIVRKIFLNSGWLFFDKVIRLVMGLIVGAWTARYLGPENYGLLSYANAFVTIYATIVTFGIDGLVIRDLSKEKNIEKRKEILGTAFRIRFIGGWISIFICIGTIFLIQENVLISLLVTIISLGNIFQSFDTIALLYQAEINSKITVKVKFIAFIITTLLKIIAILFNAGVIWFAILTMLEIALGAIGLVYVYKDNIFKYAVSVKLIKLFLKNSWPIFLSMICINVYLKLDQLILGQYMGIKLLGCYAAAIKISEICYFIPNVIISSFTPYLVNCREHDKIIYKQRIQQVFDALTYGAYFICIIITITSPIIMKILYGNKYENADLILIIHIWTLIFVGIGVLFRQVLIIENKTKFLLLTTVLGTVVAVVLDFWLIPKYSFYGAVLSIILSQMISNYFSTILYKETREFFLMQTKSLLLINLPNYIRRLIY